MSSCQPFRLDAPVITTPGAEERKSAPRHGRPECQRRTRVCSRNSHDSTRNNGRRSSHFPGCLNAANFTNWLCRRSHRGFLLEEEGAIAGGAKNHAPARDAATPDENPVARLGSDWQRAPHTRAASLHEMSATSALHALIAAGFYTLLQCCERVQVLTVGNNRDLNSSIWPFESHIARRYC